MGYQARTKFDWVIEDFRQRPEKVSNVISSGIFSVSRPDNQVTEWCLQIYPERRHKGSCCKSKSKNLVLVQASM